MRIIVWISQVIFITVNNKKEQQATYSALEISSIMVDYLILYASSLLLQQALPISYLIIIKYLIIIEFNFILTELIRIHPLLVYHFYYFYH